MSSVRSSLLQGMIVEATNSRDSADLEGLKFKHFNNCCLVSITYRCKS